ncbi:TMPRSS4 isoform 8 [Pongo abelii]|uniref:TMPRSS4 isoform 8 n=1 Tax=Pongo abelii TaxID=9601 RepID=A0A2J8X134_PONAB|nr:TMPRSS4 isoform 8 [Pongo abelii]
MDPDSDQPLNSLGKFRCQTPAQTPYPHGDLQKGGDPHHHSITEPGEYHHCGCPHQGDSG